MAFWKLLDSLLFPGLYWFYTSPAKNRMHYIKEGIRYVR